MQAHFIILIELTRADEMSGVRRHIAAFVISMDGQIQTHQFHKLLIVSKTQSLFFEFFFLKKKSLNKHSYELLFGIIGTPIKASISINVFTVFLFEIINVLIQITKSFFFLFFVFTKVLR